MSGTSMTSEFTHLAEAFGYTVRDMEWFTVNAMKSAFLPFDERLALIADVIKPAYAELRAEGSRTVTLSIPLLGVGEDGVRRRRNPSDDVADGWGPVGGRDCRRWHRRGHALQRS